jgi:hypothetical protein
MQEQPRRALTLLFATVLAGLFLLQFGTFIDRATPALIDDHDILYPLGDKPTATLHEIWTDLKNTEVDPDLPVGEQHSPVVHRQFPAVSRHDDAALFPHPSDFRHSERARLCRALSGTQIVGRYLSPTRPGGNRMHPGRNISDLDALAMDRNRKNIRALARDTGGAAVRSNEGS